MRRCKKEKETKTKEEDAKIKKKKKRHKTFGRYPLHRWSLQQRVLDVFFSHPRKKGQTFVLRTWPWP